MESTVLDIKRRLKTVYVDNDLEVLIAPNERELEEIVLEILSKLRVATVKQIHSYLEAVASEEKIRKVLHKLVTSGRVKQYFDGRYELLQDGARPSAGDRR